MECPVESVPECEPEPQWNACEKYQSVRLHRLLGLESAQERHRNQHEGIRASFSSSTVKLVHISESEPHLHGLLAPLSRAKAPTHVMETNG